MSRDIEISILLEFYGKLLTEKQANALDLYYNMDYSLSEIAEHVGVTRQGVRAFIKNGENRLRSLEAALSMARRFAAIESAAENIRRIAQSCGGEVAAEIGKYIEEISKANDMEL